MHASQPPSDCSPLSARLAASPRRLHSGSSAREKRSRPRRGARLRKTDKFESCLRASTSVLERAPPQLLPSPRDFPVPTFEKIILGDVDLDLRPNTDEEEAFYHEAPPAARGAGGFGGGRGRAKASLDGSPGDSSTTRHGGPQTSDEEGRRPSSEDSSGGEKLRFSAIPILCVDAPRPLGVERGGDGCE